MSEKLKEGLLWATAAVMVGLCCLTAAIDAPTLHGTGNPAVTVERGSTGPAKVTTASTAAPTEPTTAKTTAQPTSTVTTTVPDRNHTLVNINTADRETLMTLKGIGPTLADRIIAYRESYGKFKLTDELKQVKGIGDKTFAELAPYICTE